MRNNAYKCFPFTVYLVIRINKKNAVKLFVKSFLVALIVVASSVGSFAQSELRIGAKAPVISQKVEDYSGRSITLSEANDRNGLIVLFSCNTCPWVSRWEERYVEASNYAKVNQIGMIALNSNERIRERGESMEDMKKRANKKGYNFYYALDKDNIIADAFGAKNTPQVFLFNQNMELVYKGAIDDSPNSANGVKENHLRVAIDEMLQGKKVTKPITKSVGCPIKRKE